MLDTVYALLEHGREPNLRCGQMSSALMAACVRGRNDIISTLAARGADVIGSTSRLVRDSWLLHDIAMGIWYAICWTVV